MEYRHMIAPTLRTTDRQSALSAERFFDDIPALACRIGSDGCLNCVNGAWFDLLGYSSQSLVGKPFAKFFHSEDIPLLEKELIRCGPQETWDRFEARFRCQDGGYKWLLWQFKTDPERRSIYAVAFDVTDRKHEESAVRRRLTASNLRGQIWTPFTNGSSTSQTLQVWADVLQRHLATREVRIWVPAQSQAKPVLQARSVHPVASGESLVDSVSLETFVHEVLASRASLVIPDVNAEPRLAQHREVFRDRNIKAIYFQPVLSQEQAAIAALGLFFATECGAAEGYFIETTAQEMGAAWSLLALNENLRATKRTYEALFRSATVGISRIDSDGNVKAWNAAAEKILGWRSTEILTRRFPIAGLSERELFETCLQGAFAGKSTLRIEIKCCSSIGKPVDVAVSISPLADAEGVTAQAMVVFEELTERKRASRSLRLQKTIAETLAGASSIGDPLSAVLATMCGEFGWDCGEFWQLYQPDQVFKRAANWHSAAPNAVMFASESQDCSPSAETELFRQILREGKSRRFAGCGHDRTFPRSDLAGRFGLDDAIAFPVAAGRGSDAGVLLFFANAIDTPDEAFVALMATISDQIGQFLYRFRMEESLRQAEQDLLQAKKMDAIGRLVGGVVHDFNNVLTVILGFGEIVLEEGGSNESTRELLTEVINSGKRAAALTRQLLTFCRKEAAELVIFDLNVTVTEIEKMLRRLIGEDIELVTELAPGLRRLNADPGHIEQIIMNLVVNARDAMPQGGRIVIATQAVELDASSRKTFPGANPGHYALLSVSDTGCGMDEATRSRIFEPFFTTKPSGKGTGMGLATVCEIVKEAGGHIVVESQPGKGTTFRLLLPTVSQGLTSWQVDSAPASIPRGHEAVLVVEDDQNVRRLIGRILKNQGYAVLEAAGSMEAIELCRTDPRRIDVLITDIVMPRMNGHELATNLRRRLTGLKVLFVSGYGEGELRRSNAFNRDTPYLQKPFTTYDLARKVRDICDS
jgi:PAS domain S-box-containing protein